MMVGKGKILVIDDEQDICEIVKSYLRDFDVTTCNDPEKALEIAKTQRFDTIISDLKMPRLSGHAVLKALQAIVPDTPVIMISGHVDNFNFVQTLRLGAYAFIEKPIKQEELLSTVRRAIGRKSLEIKLKNVGLKQQAGGPNSGTAAPEIIAVTMNASIASVYATMIKFRIRHMPVATEDGRPLGIISDRDILKYFMLSPDGSYSFPDLKARDIMSKNLVTCTTETSLDVIAATMLEHRIDSVLIVENETIAGIITSSDFLKMYIQQAKNIGRSPVPLKPTQAA